MDRHTSSHSIGITSSFRPRSLGTTLRSVKTAEKGKSSKWATALCYSSRRSKIVAARRRHSPLRAGYVREKGEGLSRMRRNFSLSSAPSRSTSEIPAIRQRFMGNPDSGSSNNIAASTMKLEKDASAWINPCQSRGSCRSDSEFAIPSARSSEYKGSHDRRNGVPSQTAGWGARGSKTDLPYSVASFKLIVFYLEKRRSPRSRRL